ncbi:MAG: glutamine-synthetase adenylyltransferase, partial [Sphingopyxis sp.]|nr:glutamine-synthetase adenylyltransferase [Sphingopyxis sp.]
PVPREPVKLAADAVDMRDKSAAHKPPKGPLDIKGGPGGLVDLEFAMQVTQLASGKCHDPNIGSALACLRIDGLAPAEICDAHGLLARMLVMLRLTAPEGEPATAAARQLVASACGEPGWPQLLAAHDAARQEIADWWTSIRPPQQETKP